MSSSYSSSLRVELIGSGDQAGTWGTTTDNNFEYIFDTAIAGYQAVTITSTSQLLTSLNGPTSSVALNQSVYAFLKFNSASAATNIFAPPVSKQYIIWNNSGHAITIYNSAVINVIPSPITTTGVTIANGNKVMVWSDGTNFYDVQAQNLTGTLAIANGGTGQITANAAFNALAPSQTSANGKYLKSDGTNTAFDQIDISTGDITGILPVLNGGTGVTTSTGSGNNVLSTSPTITSATMITPVLGTPSSGNLANCTFPTLNQNTSGTAAGLSATLAVASGGTGQTTAVNAGSALGAIGVGQTTQNVVSSRAASITYTNNTGRPIMVYISTVNSGPSAVTAQEIFVDGISILFGGTQANRRAAYTFIVPNNSTYFLNTGDTIINWCELRV